MASKVYSFRLSGKPQLLLEEKAKELFMKPNLFVKKIVMSKLLDKYIELEKKQNEFFSE